MTESNRYLDITEICVRFWERVTETRTSERKGHTHVHFNQINFRLLLLFVECSGITRRLRDIIICELVTWISLCFRLIITHSIVSIVLSCVFRVYLCVYIFCLIYNRFVGEIVMFRVSWVLFWNLLYTSSTSSFHV